MNNQTNERETRPSFEKMLRKSTERYVEKKHVLDKRTGRKLGGGGRRKR